MDRKDIAALVERAIRRVIDEERDLLERDGSERTLADHLARFIRDDIPEEYSVDVEYNRHGEEPKRLDLLLRNHPDEGPQAALVSPDILVHVRGTDEHNLLVLEVKKSDRDLTRDEQKLRAFRTQLHYEHAAHVILGNDDNTMRYDILWVDETSARVVIHR